MTASTADPIKPMTEAEVEAEREQARVIYARTTAALDRLQARGFKGSDLVTAAELIDVFYAAIGYAVACSRGVVRKHAVLKTDLEASVLRKDVVPGTKALWPLWAGIWDKNKAYAVNSLVAHKHCLWFAKQATVNEPGVPGGGGWQLCLRGPR
jgi:hypothetical protein